MIKLRIFVSSVQKKLADERRAVKTLITSDPFLDEHCVPILYEDEPSMLKPAPQGYLDVLARCQVYLVIIGSEYGKRYKGLDKPQFDTERWGSMNPSIIHRRFSVIHRRFLCSEL